MSELAELLCGATLRTQNSDGGGPNHNFDKGDLYAAWEILSGVPERPEKMLSIVLEPSQLDNSTSWLGGLPLASKQFIWPRGKDSKNLHFMGQIDLKSLHSCYEGVTPPKLPITGAIAFFFDRDSWRVKYIDTQEIGTKIRFDHRKIWVHWVNLGFSMMNNRSRGYLFNFAQRWIPETVRRLL